MKIPPAPALFCFVLLGMPISQVAAQEREIVQIQDKEEATITLDSLVGGKEVWQSGPADVEKAFKKKGFAWLDEKTKARGLIRPREVYFAKSTQKSTGGQTVLEPVRQKVNLLGAPAYEATLEFTSDKLASVSISVWNKGDAEEPLAKKEYDALILKTTTALDAALKVKGRDIGSANAGAMKISRWRWETPDTIAQLETSSGRDADRNFSAEFVRLRLIPKGGKSLDTMAATTSKLAPTVSLVSRVKKLPDGDVYVEGVPMVDQGEKGYCAVASAERVMRYYGIQVDQHELARAADTSQYGTNPQDFEQALHKLQGKFKIRVRDLITFDQRDYERMVESYNREAKKAGGLPIEAGSYYFKLNPDIWREARCRVGAFEKFRGMVTTATARGMPLLWALTLGRYPETGHENPQAMGGHMRTIIGYNTKTDEVLFTDSWGAGHELKKMKGRDACAATLGLYLVEPAN